MTHIVRKFCANIRVTYAPDSRRMRVTFANPTQMLGEPAARGVRNASKDVTFGPICISPGELPTKVLPLLFLRSGDRDKVEKT
jgi:hypothetical protein